MTNKTKTQTHTPGPLYVKQRFDDHFLVKEKNGNNIAVLGSPNDYENAYGDALLFAAAPDLLEAATGAKNWLESMPYDKVLQQILDNLRAALNKAEGR